MSGPNHLWSGDWQRESDAAGEQLDGRRAAPAEQPPSQPSPSPAPTEPRVRRPGRTLSIVVVAVLVLGGVAYGLTALLGNSRSPAPVASTPALTAPTPSPQPPASPAVAPANPSSPPVSWLGMEIGTVPPGAAVVETVKLGSAGDLAGLEPGDVIVEINNHAINSASDIAPTIKGLPAGQQVSIQVSNGSTLQQDEITLAAPPTPYP
jgi:membrane-associated protease RseP (regulator of RpoE activity)